MKKARKDKIWRLASPLTLLGALSLSVFIAGCEDDENIPGGAAGSSTAGAGGSAAGTGGTAGTAGVGGAGAGGTAGAGAGGAGAGGAGAGGAGAGGDAGASGAGAGGDAGASGAGAGGDAGASGAGAGGDAGASGAGAGGDAGAAGNAGGGGDSGAGGGGGATLCGEATGNGELTGDKIKAVATGGSVFVSPFDAVPSPDGCSVYFTALDPATGGGAVFMVMKDGSGLQRLDQGNLLSAPVGISISSDGQTLYIADVGYSDGGADAGAILSLAAGGGTPAVSIAGRQARSISVVKENDVDQLYFGGSGATGQATLFKATPGGNPSAVVEGGTLGEPGGIASDGTKVFLVSSVSTGAIGSLLEVNGNAATVVVGGLRVGLNGGAALSGDGSAVLVAAQGASGASSIARVVLADKTVTFTAIGAQSEPSGLHRAMNAEVYSFVDGLGANGSGAVWVAEK
ncbi:MAG: hypothetical protein MUF64_02090 [Polyangiaceae bacterium]|nr:hypothetical protein [Polyangiaceae bacterium]